MGQTQSGLVATKSTPWPSRMQASSNFWKVSSVSKPHTSREMPSSSLSVTWKPASLSCWRKVRVPKAYIRAPSYLPRMYQIRASTEVRKSSAVASMPMPRSRSTYAVTLREELLVTNRYLPPRSRTARRKSFVPSKRVSPR